MAWNIGANDVANAMGTSVGSGALTLKRAVILAAILEFCGAVFLGSNVSNTIQTGIVDPNFFTDKPLLFVYGMLSSLLATGIWLQIASFKGWPVSTSHSIIGAIVGFGLVFGGVDSVNWSNCSSIFLSWVISPVAGGVMANVIFSLLRHGILYSKNPLEKAKGIVPIIIFFVFALLTGFIVFDGITDVSFTVFQGILLIISVGLLGALTCRYFTRRILIDPSSANTSNCEHPQVQMELEKGIYSLEKAHLRGSGELQFHLAPVIEETKMLLQQVQTVKKDQSQNSPSKEIEKIFGYLQIITAGFMAFAHGANDVANAIGPLAAVISTAKTMTITIQSKTPIWLLVLGGVGIVVGLATWGWRVIETIGKKITELDPTRGFSAEFGTALTIIGASKLGLPISTTHTLVGALLGIGLARGIGSINLSAIKQIVMSWIVTIPIGAILCIICTYIFNIVLGH